MALKNKATQKSVKNKKKDVVNISKAPAKVSVAPPASSQKWYKGDNPTRSETIAQMYRVAADDKERQRELERMYEEEIRTIGSPIYNPYTQPTNWKAVEGLREAGVLQGDVTREWFDANIGLMNEGRLTATGLVPAAPTKSSTAAQNTAYWMKVLGDREADTREAEDQLAALAGEVKYYADRGYSDEAILQRVYGDDFSSRYGMLARMDDGRMMGDPVILNRAIDYDGEDTIHGMIWAARNDYDGNYTLAAVMGHLGNGVQYRSDPASEAARDPSNAQDYHPYYGGSNMHDVNIFTGQTSYDDAWLEVNRGWLNGTEEQKRAWQSIYDANENTKAAQAELTALDDWLAARIELGRYSADELIDMYAAELNGGEYPTLVKMERERKRGGYMKLASEVDFTDPRYRQKIRDALAEADAAKAEAARQAEEEAQAAAAAKQEQAESKAEAAIAGGSGFMSGNVPGQEPAKVEPVSQSEEAPKAEETPKTEEAQVMEEQPEAPKQGKSFADSLYEAGQELKAWLRLKFTRDVGAEAEAFAESREGSLDEQIAQYVMDAYGMVLTGELTDHERAVYREAVNKSRIAQTIRTKEAQAAADNAVAVAQEILGNMVATDRVTKPEDIPESPQSEPVDIRSTNIYRDLFGVAGSAAEGAEDMQPVPQSAEGEVGEIQLLGANGSGNMDPNSEDGQAFISMLEGGEWNGTVYTWALANTSDRVELQDELEQGILALRSGTDRVQVNGLARSWWDAHAHLVDYSIKGVDYSRNFGVVADQYDVAQY